MSLNFSDFRPCLWSGSTRWGQVQWKPHRTLHVTLLLLHRKAAYAAACSIVVLLSSR